MKVKYYANVSVLSKKITIGEFFTIIKVIIDINGQKLIKLSNLKPNIVTRTLTFRPEDSNLTKLLTLNKLGGSWNREKPLLNIAWWCWGRFTYLSIFKVSRHLKQIFQDILHMFILANVLHPFQVNPQTQINPNWNP